MVRPLGPDCFMVSYYRVKVNKLGDPWYLKVFNDTHSFSPLHAKNDWAQWIEEARHIKNALFIGLGDYTDLASTSERDILENPALHESTQQMINDIGFDFADNYVEQISFMKGRLIGLVEGHHYTNLLGRGHGCISSTEYMSKLLGCAYLGALAFIRVEFIYRKHKTNIDIYAHHGKGASRLLGGSINTVQYMAEAAEADIYLMAHDHKIIGGVGGRFQLHKMPTGKMDVIFRDSIYCRTGGLLRGFQSGKASYLAKNAKGPAPLRLATIKMTPKFGDGNVRSDFYVKLNVEV